MNNPTTPRIVTGGIIGPGGWDKTRLAKAQEKAVAADFAVAVAQYTALVSVAR